MKNLRKLHVLAVALVMVLCMMATTLFVAASGTGEQFDPYVCDQLPETITIPAGATVYYVAPLGNLELVVEDATGATAVVGGMGWPVAYTSENGGTAVVPFNASEKGELVKFGLWNQNPGADVVVTMSVQEPPVGSEANPENANDKLLNLGSVQCYFINTDLEAGDEDGYWYVFTAPSNGVLCLENSLASGGEYQIELRNENNYNLAIDGVYSNPVTTYPVTKGEVVKIHIYAECEGATIPATSVNACIFMSKGTESDPVSIKSKEGFKAYVPGGKTVCYVDGTTGGEWAGKGLVVSGASDVIANATVIVDDVAYTDVDGDGTIEITIAGDPNSMLAIHPFIDITNGCDYNASFTLTLGEAVSEDAPAVPELGYCSCGNDLVYESGCEATCHQNGMQEYWFCPECDAVYADEAGTQLTNRKNLVIVAECELVYQAGYEATCHQTGSYEYWFCPECDAVFADAAGIQLTNRKNLTIPALTELVYVEGYEASCHQTGLNEYWYCSECDAVFADAAGTQLTNRKNQIIPAIYDLVYVEAVEPGCHQTGSYEYWYCPECETVFADAAATQVTNRKNLTIPAIYDLVYVEAVEPGCHQNGLNEYWYCPECDAVFADAAGTQLTNRKNLTIPATSEMVHVDAVDPVCHQTGNVEYWYCSECFAVFTDAAA
ncbi:MAG: hypothetical protein IJX82_03580, partial [Clostridia bacterium]|nr:hypothetical protein [Clostridia bacterium]